jgi:hypothetical protein
MYFHIEAKKSSIQARGVEISYCEFVRDTVNSVRAA